MASSSKTDASADAPADNKKHQIEIGRVLRATLPGLSAEELRSLESTVYSELELRVGTLLTAGLTESQLEEFEKLMEAGDEAASTRWMKSNLPDHGRTTEVATAGLLGQTIAYLGRKIPEALTGEPLLVDGTPVTLDLVRSHFSRNGFKFGGDKAVLKISFGMPDGQPTITLQISVVEGNPAFVNLIAVASEQSYPADAKGALLDFANDLNKKSLMVMAYVRDESDAVRLYASAGLLLPERVSVESFDGLFATTMSHLMLPFRRLWELTGNDEDFSDKPESVVDPDGLTPYG